MAEWETVRQQPLEGAPSGVDFHRRFQSWIVCLGDVGVASADVGVDHTVLTLQIFKKLCRCG